MPQRLSRILLAVEAVVICLPLTALFLFAGLPSVVYGIVHTPNVDTTAEVAAAVVILGGLLCGWRLLVAFVLSGSALLQRVALFWWVVPAICGVLALIDTVYAFTATVIEPSALHQFAWGIPLVIPFVHLACERWLRMTR